MPLGISLQDLHHGLVIGMRYGETIDGGWDFDFIEQKRKRALIEIIRAFLLTLIIGKMSWFIRTNI